MKKTQLFLLAIIALLVVILMLQQCGSDKGPKEVVRYEYVTDTAFANKVYRTLREEMKNFEKKWDSTPPKQVTYYITPEAENVTIEKIPDSLILWIDQLNAENDSLRLAISDKYIKNHPTASKLIDFSLTRDTLDIRTLTIAGETKGEAFPLYLNEFDYYWEGNTLYHRKTKNPFRADKPSRWRNLYINGGYEWFENVPTLGLEYYVEFGKFKVEAKSSALFLQEPQLRGEVTLGYRLFK